MNYDTNTVVAFKSAFLKAQIRILSQGLQIPDSWLNDDRELPLALVEDVLRQANRLLRQHVKAAYSSLAIRHVAEQIDKLYWNAAEPLLEQGEISDDLPRRDADLTLDETISQLPSSWADPDTSLSFERRETQLEDFAEQSSYSDSVSQLRSLAKRRAVLRTRLDQLRALKDILDPFREPQSRVQPNLTTKDGELARELTRMRALTARVGGRLGELQNSRIDNMEDSDGGLQLKPDWKGANEKMTDVLRMS
ncbi:hypothetical protein EV356DRAFT_518271 [Viridothelium virens]|uniref:Kinetochore protein fta4 n=1 Tax=Viridothelium virens TaxID=1048519 RepID=A0A6A6H1F9_VIRVR|nr:hypothetical protein EV356DRAFT_518271 [Viridothelium virens]